MHCTQHQVDPIFTFIVTHESAHAHNELRAFSTTNSAVIYQTLGRVFHQISKHREVVEKTGAAEFFFYQPQGVWISDETPFRRFDITSQTINNSWRKSKQKFTKFYDN